MILKLIMTIVVPISIILVLSLIMNSVFILVQLPQSVERGQELTRSLYNETMSIQYSYNKILSKLMIPALRDLFVVQELLSQTTANKKQFDQDFQYFETNQSNADELVTHLSQFRLIIKTNITITCENGVMGVYGSQNIKDYSVLWNFEVRNCTDNSCIQLNEYSSYWIKPKVNGDYIDFSLIVTILNQYRCLITERQPLRDFIGYIKSWDPINIYRGLIVDSVLYQVNKNDEIEQGNLTQVSRTYINQTDEWINNIYDQVNDCGYQFNTFEYEGMNEQKFMCRTTLVFIQNPLLQCITFNITTKINFSILFLETFTVEHNNNQVGQLNIQIEVNRFITVLFFLQLILFLYTWRQAVKASLSFVIPVRIVITKILEQSVNDLSKQHFQDYNEYKNSKNVGEFIEAVVDYANSVKYQSNHFEMNAEGLMMISNSKKFFKKLNNLSAVGLCSNNIARIHAINKRYLEALNEQEESIQLAEQELQSLQQLDELHLELSKSRNWFQVYQSFRSRLLQRFVGEDRILERLQSQNFQPHLTKMLSMEFKQRSNTMQLKRRSSASSNLDKIRLHNQLATQNINNTSIAMLQQIERSNQSVLKDDPIIEENCRNKVKLKLLNRQYQLLQILGQFSNEHQQLFLNEILQLLLQMKKDTKKCLISSTFIQELSFNVRCQLVYYFTKSNQICKAKKLLKKLPNNQQHVRQNITQSINIFNQTPQLLIQSKLILLKAIIDLKTNKINQCCQKLLTIMSTSIFDPILYNYSYNLLHQIFQKSQLNTKLLEQLQLTNQQIHALILIDYTNQMTEEQIKQSHSIAKYILSLFSQQDQIGLYAFNSTFHQIFPLQNYKPYLQNCLNQLLLPPGGESNLFNLLQTAAGSFFTKNKIRQKEEIGGSFKSNASISNDRSVQYSLSNAGDVLDKYLQTNFHDKIEDEQDVKSQLRIIILFAEMVKDYSQSNKEILRQIMNKRKIHLIVIHIANQNLNRIYLESFKDITSQSCILKPTEVPSYFEQIRPAPFIKRQYIEFF